MYDAFVGVDLGVRNSYFHVDDPQGQRVHRGRYANTRQEFVEFMSMFEGESIRVCLESTTNSRAVWVLLQDCARDVGVDASVEVLDARRLRIIAQSVSKCDRLDAARIADLARSNLRLPTCYMPDDEVFCLREYLRNRADLVRMRTMRKNRVHSVLHRRGILAPTSMDLFSKLGRYYLGQLKLDQAGRDALEDLLAGIDLLDERIKQAHSALRALTRQPRWARPAALLRSMPGVGLITSLTILAELGDPKRFRSRAAVANYAGLVPVGRDSSEKVFRGRITRHGPTHLRAVLVEAAWMAYSRVPVYEALFDRIARKRNRPTAIVAVARRMLEDAWTMLKNDSPFRMVAPPGACAPASESQCGTPTASGVAG